MRHTEDWIVEAEGVEYTYEGNGKPALCGLDLKIRRGTKAAVMGGNGSGKSTLFLCLNGVLRPQKGRILIEGKPISYDRKGLLEVREKVGIVFQEPDNQLFSASVFQEISFGILNLGVGEETARREVERVIAEIGIEGFRDRPAHALSGGQKKQVAIADILVMSPEIMILDEPVAALDPRHTRIVEEIVDKLTQKGITVLMATHDVDYAYQWADEMILLKDGKVLCQGTSREVCADRALLEQANLERPAVCRVYEALVEKGYLPAGEMPRSMEELTGRL